MWTTRPHHKLALVALLPAALLLATLPLAGCSQDDPTGPQEQAPALPDPELLAFDFSFFARGDGLSAAKTPGVYDNFLAAYGRAAVLQIMARLVMAPPVAAFSLALHTVPSRQDDGSWIWVYTFVNGDEEAQIRLRGLARGDAVDWELRVTVLQADPPLDRALWFAGTTSDDGETGTWTFHDLDDPAQPVSGEIAWGDDLAGRYLRFTSNEPENDGDTLTFRDADPDYSITYIDVSESHDHFIRWHADAHGSLQVPDYNGGAEACWGTDLRNIDCR